MKKTVAWALCVLWMAVIFSMSAQTADVSSSQSGLLAELAHRIITLLSFGRLSIAPDALELPIRKLAHFSEYAVLAFLFRRALRLSGAKHATLYAIFLSAGYAATDELHQGFVDGRSPGVLDVAIDTLGACAGAWFHVFMQRLFSRKNA